MKTRSAIENGTSAARSPGVVHRAIDWLENYVRNNPHTKATTEARNLIRDLEGVRLHPNIDELITLLGHIAITAGRQEKAGCGNVLK